MGPPHFSQNNLQFPFPCVIIFNPKHPHHNTRCFYHYFLGGVVSNMQFNWTQSRTPSSTSFGSTSYAFQCAFCDLSWSHHFVPRDLIGQLSPTGYSWQLMAPTYSMDCTRSYTAFSCLNRPSGMPNRRFDVNRADGIGLMGSGWWDRADGIGRMGSGGWDRAGGRPVVKGEFSRAANANLRGHGSLHAQR